MPDRHVTSSPTRHPPHLPRRSVRSAPAEVPLVPDALRQPWARHPEPYGGPRRPPPVPLGGRPPWCPSSRPRRRSHGERDSAGVYRASRATVARRGSDGSGGDDSECADRPSDV